MRKQTFLILVVLILTPSFFHAVEEEVNLDYIRGRQLILEGKFPEAIPLLENALKADAKNAFVNHQLTEAYLRVGDLEKAEAAAKKSVEANPKNIEYLTTLGAVLASTKKYEEAKVQYRKVLEVEPTHTKAPLLLAILEAESGNLKGAVDLLTTQIGTNTENPMPLFYRAKLYLEMDNAKGAKEDLDKCLTLRPSFVEAGTALGLLLEKENDTDAAITAYNRIQGNGQYKKRLSNLYIQKNQLDKAVESLEEYEGVEPDDYTARLKIGLIYFELKQMGKAKEAFLKVLKEQPDAENVHFYLGWVYEEEKKYDDALKSFKKVTKESNLFKEASLHLGYLYKETGKLNEGIEFCKKLILKNPEIIEFYDLQATLYDAQKEYKKAMAAIDKGLVKSPEEEKLLYFKGALFDKIGEKMKGIELMKKIIAKNANNPHALNFLGYTYSEMGSNLPEAQGYIEQALKLRPNDGYIIDSLGWVYFKQGQIAKAEEQLKLAISIQPEEAIILEHLGDLELHKKNYALSMEYYEKAIKFSGKKDKEMIKKIEKKLASISKENRLPSSPKE